MTSPWTFNNPILPGFHPDPSVCRVGEDYYLITSTFEYFPGVPIFHSRDLVHWRCLGHVLDRASQLNLDDVEPSQGIYAPTIRYHEGCFYVVVTIRRPAGDGAVHDDNIIVTTTDPAGDWSEPVTLVDQSGVIDPSLFFDDDGRAWYVANARVEDPPYPGHRDIWMQELDLVRLALAGERTLLWNGALKGASAPEAPHIYKVDGTYYLMLAEAGTFHDHAVTIARADAVTGPYEGNTRNPILTHRHLGMDSPITNPGHADLIDTPGGEWWMVALGSRPCGGYFYNLGRETFLTPVVWEEGWPVVNPGHGRIRPVENAPGLSPHPWPSEPACDHFDRPSLSHHWNLLRTPRTPFHSLDERPGHLRLYLRPQGLTEWSNPAFLGRRLQHYDFAVRTVMDFSPETANECAGLVLMQNADNQFRFLREGGKVVVTQRRQGEERVLGSLPADEGLAYLKVEGRGQSYSFYYGASPESWVSVAQEADGRVLSTQVAGGFVGAYVGVYASANGESSSHSADFDYFEYAPLGQ